MSPVGSLCALATCDSGRIAPLRSRRRLLPGSAARPLGPNSEGSCVSGLTTEGSRPTATRHDHAPTKASRTLVPSVHPNDYSLVSRRILVVKWSTAMHSDSDLSASDGVQRENPNRIRLRHRGDQAAEGELAIRHHDRRSRARRSGDRPGVGRRVSSLLRARPGGRRQTRPARWSQCRAQTIGRAALSQRRRIPPIPLVTNRWRLVVEFRTRVSSVLRQSRISAGTSSFKSHKRPRTGRSVRVAGGSGRLRPKMRGADVRAGRPAQDRSVP